MKLDLPPDLKPEDLEPEPMTAAIRINGHDFTPNPECRYKYDYVKVVDKINANEWREVDAYRTLVKNDLFFIVYFVMGVEINHPFLVQACQDIENSRQDKIVFLWAREHFKSTVITNALLIQKLLCNPELRIAIFSYAKTPAVKLLRPIKTIFESSSFLKALFPDVLYENPEGESPKWSEQDGITVKRKGFYKEASIEAHGLIEGMPTGSHFDHRHYDDVVTADNAKTPEVMQSVKECFDVSLFLGTAHGTEIVVGTPYHWEDAIQYICNKKYEDGTPVYEVSKKPCTDDGTENGKPVWLPAEKIRQWKTDKKSFNAQGLLNPSPESDRKLNSNLIKIVSKDQLPSRLYKFMIVDGAGEKAKLQSGKDADAWSFGVIGVDPILSEVGVSSIYILDLFISPSDDGDAYREIVDMYMRNGRILKLGVEKTGTTTVEVHVANALKAKGRHINVANGKIQIVRPSGRDKHQRIIDALEWPLTNGKFHVLDSVNEQALSRLRTEMDKFPYWHDDGCDMISYVYDLIRQFPFNTYAPSEQSGKVTKSDKWEEAFRRARERREDSSKGWMGA